MEPPDARIEAAPQLFGGKLFVVHLVAAGPSSTTGKPGFTAKLRKLVLKSIFANGGHIIGTDDAYVEGADYVIATHEQQALVRQTREAQAGGAATCIFGPQWVLACVDEGQLLEANDAFGLLAEPPTVGIPGFRENGSFMHVSGIPADIKNLKLLLQYWVESMGGRVETEAVGAHVSHVLTWQEGALLPRHLAILSKFPHIRFVNYRWIMACHDSKALISEEPFLLQMPVEGLQAPAAPQEGSPAEQKQALQELTGQELSGDADPSMGQVSSKEQEERQLQQQEEEQEEPASSTQEQQLLEPGRAHARAVPPAEVKAELPELIGQQMGPQIDGRRPSPDQPRRTQQQAAERECHEQGHGLQSGAEQELQEHLISEPAVGAAAAADERSAGEAAEQQQSRQHQHPVDSQQQQQQQQQGGHHHQQRQPETVAVDGGRGVAGVTAAAGPCIWIKPEAAEAEVEAGADTGPLGVVGSSGGSEDGESQGIAGTASQPHPHPQPCEHQVQPQWQSQCLEPQAQHVQLLPPQEEGMQGGLAGAQEAQQQPHEQQAHEATAAALDRQGQEQGQQGQQGEWSQHQQPDQELPAQQQHEETEGHQQEQRQEEQEQQPQQEEQQKEQLPPTGYSPPPQLLHQQQSGLVAVKPEPRGASLGCVGVAPGAVLQSLRDAPDGAEGDARAGASPEPPLRRPLGQLQPGQQPGVRRRCCQHQQAAPQEADAVAPSPQEAVPETTALQVPPPQEEEEEWRTEGSPRPLVEAQQEQEEVQDEAQRDGHERPQPGSGGAEEAEPALATAAVSSRDPAEHAPAGPPDWQGAATASPRVKLEPEHLTAGAGAIGPVPQGPAGVGVATTGDTGGAGQDAGAAADVDGGATSPRPASAPVPSSEEPSQQAVMRAHRRVAAMLPSLLGSASESAEEATPLAGGGGGAAAGPLLLRCMASFAPGCMGAASDGACGGKVQAGAEGAAVVEPRCGGPDAMDAAPEVGAGPDSEALDGGVLPSPTAGAGEHPSSAPAAAAAAELAVTATAAAVAAAEAATAAPAGDAKGAVPPVQGKKGTAKLASLFASGALGGGAKRGRFHIVMPSGPAPLKAGVLGRDAAGGAAGGVGVEGGPGDVYAAAVASPAPNAGAAKAVEVEAVQEEEHEQRQPAAAKQQAARAGGKQPEGKAAAQPTRQRQRKNAKDTTAEALAAAAVVDATADVAETQGKEEKAQPQTRIAAAVAGTEQDAVAAEDEDQPSTAVADAPKVAQRRKRQQGAGGGDDARAADVPPPAPMPGPELQSAAAGPQAPEQQDAPTSLPAAAAPAKGAKRKAKAPAAAAAVAAATTTANNDSEAVAPAKTADTAGRAPPAAPDGVLPEHTAAPEAGGAGVGAGDGVDAGNAQVAAAGPHDDERKQKQAPPAKGIKRKAKAAAPVAPTVTAATEAAPGAQAEPGAWDAGEPMPTAELTAAEGGAGHKDKCKATVATEAAAVAAEAKAQPKTKRRRAAAPKPQADEGAAALEPEAKPMAELEVAAGPAPEAEVEVAAAAVGAPPALEKVPAGAAAAKAPRARAKAAGSKKAKAETAAVAAAAADAAAGGSDGQAGGAASPPGPFQPAVAAVAAAAPKGNDCKGAGTAGAKRAGGKRSAGEAELPAGTVSPPALKVPATAAAAGGGGAGGCAADPGQLTYALSGFSRSEDRAQYGNLLTKLGLTYIGAQGWDPRITALLAPSLKRSDKSVCAMAAGAWLLNTDFLHALQRQQQGQKAAGGGGAAAAAAAAASEGGGAAGGGGGGGGGALKLEGYELSKCEDGPAVISEGAPAHWRRRCAARGGGADARAFAGVALLVPEGLAKPLDTSTLDCMLTAGGGRCVPYRAGTGAAASGAGDAAARAGCQAAVVPAGCKHESKLVASLQAAGIPVLDGKYVVEWVAHPHRPLAAHFRHGTCAGPVLAELERRRGEVEPGDGGAAAGGGGGAAQ
ncbi:hypothetical protein HYH02_000870 [Chlamydomonas schloesseri]|uniref:BRCT domain-containing protein n=1 Tax=Chlamydomonas schloesseri TaxID=2026947 RepID=A0A836BDX1_9CHLO|nr:hypothetical protein HYH02_000870 [Chlamydomonas schloesseri]|eukprot:KAG2455045.1 hypothetical protein HYH02_000870 [Chlamydomonas schloesseri]